MGDSRGSSHSSFHPNPDALLHGKEEHGHGEGEHGKENKTTGRGDGPLISVRVQPRASRERVVVLSDGTLRVSVTAPPEGGKANAAVLELLADTLGVAKSKLRLVRGQASRNKVVAVEGMDAGQVLGKLGG